MFPTLKNKKFHDLMTGKIISVIDQFEDVAVLDTTGSTGRQRINVNKLLDNTLFEEYIDPQSFFNGSSLQTLADKIRSIPNEVLSNIHEDNGSPINESIVMPYDPEEEKMALLEKARNMNATGAMVSQIDKFKDLIEEDAFIQPQTFEEVVTRIEVPREQPNTQQNISIEEQSVLPMITDKPTVAFSKSFDIGNNFSNEPNSTQVIPTDIEDPITKIFRNIKRKNDFKFTLVVENKIPRPDFIEMMEDSYEVSLIDYLAEEFTKKLLENTSDIKEKIKQEITRLVYKEDKVNLEDKPEVRAVEVVKQEKPTRNKNKRKDDSPVND